MDETPTPFNEGLSPEDLAVLRDFDAMEFIADEPHEETPQNTTKRLSTAALPNADTAEEFSQEDMLLLFISEVEEDISVLRNGIQQLKPGEARDVVRIHSLERTAHKIKGTAGAFGCSILSTIGRYTETLLRLLTQGAAIELELLVQAIAALEGTLSSLVITGEESRAALEDLEAAFKLHALDITVDTYTSSPPSHTTESNAQKQEMSRITPRPLQERAILPVSVRVEMARFEQLLVHTGEMADLQVPLRSAQEQVEVALQELHAAQARLTRLESHYSTFPLSASVSDSTFSRQDEGIARSASSMIANILDGAEERIGHRYVRKELREKGVGKGQRGNFRSQQFSTEEPLYWDELEIDRYTETDTLKNVLSEAIADVAAASAQLRTAFALLNDTLQKQMSSVMHVRSDALSLHLTPLSSLLARIERVVAMNDNAQQGSIVFEVRGETTEIDQEMLEELKNPLLHLARTCVTPGLQERESSDLAREQKKVRVWFHATDLGNEVVIEIGSSLNVESGAVNEVQDTLRRLHGTIIVLRNNAGGMSFQLRLPRSQGSLRGLLVRAGSQHVVVPFAQIQRIDYENLEDTLSLYTLSNLPGLSAEPLLEQPKKQMYPVLVLYPENSGMRVQVDAVLGEIEQVMKPLAAYVRRAGIVGTMIDDGGDVLLVVNPVELIRHAPQQRHALSKERDSVAFPLAKSQEKVVLVADDSVSIRGSLLQTLTNAGYRAVGVDNGMEALEFLLDHAPTVLLLDIEMPYLNGYDLLSIMSAHEHLASVKTIMLTSRSSEKHRKRAMELGADAYLTKPCSQDVLLATIKSLAG
ncbi:MAG TPA: response regulator [Ktedonobacteraceae bacterium]|nr:response regulator [Ktedonobacteraceae bacterium]